MAAGTYNITAEQGARFARSIVYENPDGSFVNLTDYTARMQVRKEEYSETVALDLTTENGRITLGAAAGTIELVVDAQAMAATTAGEYHYDLELIPPSGETDVVRLLQGKFTITREITREAV